MTSLFRFHRADIFCVQEALPEQMDNLDMAFPDFGHEGVGRDDGEREGEFSAVFYNIGRFEKLDGGTFWLSETRTMQFWMGCGMSQDLFLGKVERRTLGACVICIQHPF